MFAIVNIAGKQYRVENGAQIKVPNLNSEEGSKVKFNNVLLIDNDGTLDVGNPLLSGATVSGTILKNGRDRKVIIFKKKRRKGFRRKNGHRQQHSKIQITKILAKGGKVIDEAKIVEKKTTLKDEKKVVKKVLKK